MCKYPIISNMLYFLVVTLNPKRNAFHKEWTIAQLEPCISLSVQIKIYICSTAALCWWKSDCSRKGPKSSTASLAKMLHYPYSYTLKYFVSLTFTGQIDNQSELTFSVCCLVREEVACSPRVCVRFLWPLLASCPPWLVPYISCYRLQVLCDYG